MKKALLILGVVALIVVAFLAGRFFLPRGQFFTAGGPPQISGELDRPFMMEGGPGDRFSGEVSAFDEANLTVQSEGGEMIFLIDANTRFTAFGTLAGVQVGDSVQVNYESSDSAAIALTVTVTNYLPN
jgi:hypothetical protein